MPKAHATILAPGFPLLFAFLGCSSPPVAEGGEASSAPPARQSLFAARSPQDDDEGGKYMVFTEDQAVELGAGYDADAGAFLTDKKCVLLVAAEKGGLRATMSVHSVVDQHSMNQALEVEAGAAVKTLLGSGSGKAAFSKQVDVNSAFLNYAVHAYVEAVERYARGVPSDERVRRQYFEEGWRTDRDDEYERSNVVSGVAILLTDEYRRLARGNHELFRQECGEGFVSTVYRGVEVAGVITLETYSEIDQESFSTEFEASGAYWSAEARAAGTSGESRSRKDLKVTYYESGRSDLPLPTTIDSLMSRAQHVKALLHDPRLYKVAVTPYSRLANWPRGQDDFAITDPAAEPVLYRYSAYRELFDAIHRVLDDPAGFALALDTGSARYEITVHQLRSLQDTLSQYLEALRTLIEECDGAGWDIGGCEDLSDVDSTLQSPYSFRARIPPPYVPGSKNIVGMASIPTRVTEAELRDLIAEAVLWRYRDRACRVGPEYPGCVPNHVVQEFVRLIPVQAGS